MRIGGGRGFGTPGRRALRVVAESCRDCPGLRRTAERLRQRVQGNGWESRQRSSPKRPSTPDNPSVSLRLPAPFTQGSLWDGDADCRVGPAGLLAMTMVFCHSEERSDVGIRPFYDGRGFGPPRSSAPTESPINHPSQPARSEASAPADARDGRESTQGPSQKGDHPATVWAALSEAESAGIIAGQIRFLPDDLRVQHGAESPEV